MRGGKAEPSGGKAGPVKLMTGCGGAGDEGFVKRRIGLVERNKGLMTKGPC